LGIDNISDFADASPCFHILTLYNQYLGAFLLMVINSRIGSDNDR
jgi:hypothetical protein